jgi:hypothetical protein
MFFVRQNIAEPSNASGNDQDRTEQADGSTSDKAGKQQGDAKSEDDRPRRWRWQPHSFRG